MHRAAALFLCLLGACTASREGQAHESRWATSIAKLPATWLGPEFWANRLQDWQVSEERIECLEGRENRPMRTVQRLSCRLSDVNAAFETRVRTGPMDPGPTDTATWTGFLIGAGGPGIDHRLTALCHHRPAKDGGLVVAVDGAGRVVFRDFEHNEEPGTWGIAGPLRDGEVREIVATRREGPGRTGAPLGDVLLRVRGEPAGERLTIIAEATDAESGQPLSRAELEITDPGWLSGSLALLSHRGPAGSARGYWFRDWEIRGPRLIETGLTIGPIIATQYTLHRGVLKLTAQMMPVSERDHDTATLFVPRAAAAAKDPRSGRDGWTAISSATLDRDSFTFTFRVEGWPHRSDTPFRVAYSSRRKDSIGLDATDTSDTWDGVIRAEPTDDEFVLAAFTGTKHFTGGLQWNHDGIWFPHDDLVQHVRHHDPDLLFFSGDQIYEGDLTGAQRSPPDKARLDYLDKWYRWCWAFGDLARDRPCICIPDDHDVYHGNIWGAGGRAAKNQDDGGYRMPPRFVNMVQRTQTSHLPDPVDPTPVDQGIGVYYTRLDYGGVSFAILEDRKWKSSPTVAVPEGRVKNGWFRNADFDPRDADVPGAVLLGERQLRFLRDWSTDWSGGVWMKCALSQTIFANVATLPRSAKNDGVVLGLRVFDPGGYAPDDVRVADADSNGWPQSGRNAALRELRRGFAVHVAGDQHLGSLIHYGVDTWDDAGFALCVPSIGNTFPRRWFPSTPGANRAPGMPEYTGRFLDGFGNHVTVWAVSNPHRSGKEPARLHDRAPGYGIVRFRKSTRETTFECWPRWSDPGHDGAQYPGWPKTVAQGDNYGGAAVAWLPTIEVEGMRDPVVRVLDASGEVVYALRIEGQTFRPKVFAQGSYTIEVGDPDTDRWQRADAAAALPGPLPERTVRVRLPRPEAR